MALLCVAADLENKSNEISDAAGSRLVHDGSPMHFHCSRADAELQSDLATREAAGGETQHLMLARREALDTSLDGNQLLPFGCVTSTGLSSTPLASE